MEPGPNSLFEELNRILFLLFDRCKTDREITAHRNAQKRILELEKELKKAIKK